VRHHLHSRLGHARAQPGGSSGDRWQAAHRQDRGNQHKVKFIQLYYGRRHVCKLPFA
jgi:hypothetical protein